MNESKKSEIIELSAIAKKSSRAMIEYGVLLGKISDLLSEGKVEDARKAFNAAHIEGPGSFEFQMGVMRLMKFLVPECDKKSIKEILDETLEEQKPHDALTKSMEQALADYNAGADEEK